MKALLTIAILILLAIVASAWMELDYRASSAATMPRPPVQIEGTFRVLTPAGFEPMDTTGIVLQFRGMVGGRVHSFDATLDELGNVVLVVPREGTDPMDITEYPCAIIVGCMD